MPRFLSASLTAWVSMILAGCSTSGTSIPLGDGTIFPATDPARIVILVEAPSKPHTAIALVEGTAATDDYFTEARTQAAALDALKKAAAKIGANAIILTSKGSKPYGQSVLGTANTSTTGFTTVSAIGLGFEKITLSGTAIRYL